MTREELDAQLGALGVRRGSVLLVHTSFRAVRPVEGGPIALIEALQDALGPEGTLVMPTMTDGESPFDPAVTPTWQMGVTAELFWRQRGVRRVATEETDHCCRGFARADDWLRQAGLQREGTVGRAPARIANARDVVRIAVERLASEPLVFLCPRAAGCGECDAARASIAL